MGLLQGLGQAQPVSQFIDTALKYRQSENQNQLNQLQVKQGEMQLNKMAEEDAYNKSPANMNFHPLLTTYEAGTPEHDELKKTLFSATGADEYGNTTNFKRDKGLQMFVQNKQIMEGVYQTRFNAIQNNYVKVVQQIGQAKAMGDAEKAAKLQVQADSLAAQGAAASGKWVEYQIAHEKNNESKPPEPFTLGPGQKRFDAQGKPIADVPPDTEKWSDPYDVVIDGKTVKVQKSEKSGQIKAFGQGQTTNVNVDVDMGLSKGARAKAEEDVQEATDMYKGLETLVTISKPVFFTYAGQIQAGAERLGEKAGMVKDPKLLKDYSAWKVATEQEFNKYRKWATGVAAGEIELQRLAGSFPNINMSKTQYMAAAKQTAVNAWKLAERRRRALNAGINDPGKQKEFYRLLPLDAMPDPPPEVIGRFSPKSKFEIIEVK